MAGSPYTNRELDHHFQEVKDTLARIEAQTIKTNGRVTKCEENILMGKTSARIANWAFGITIPMIIGMSVWIFFNEIQHIKEEIIKLHNI